MAGGGGAGGAGGPRGARRLLPAGGQRLPPRAHRHPRPAGGRCRNVLSAGLAATEAGLAVVVDEDIDIRDDRSIEWAPSTRFQADRDLLVLEGMRCIPLDPSLSPTGAGT